MEIFMQQRRQTLWNRYGYYKKNTKDQLSFHSTLKYVEVKIFHYNVKSALLFGSEIREMIKTSTNKTTNIQ